MKKILTVSLFTSTFSVLSAFAAATDTMITFSTKGPDKYADGTTVQDGECYALVWTKTGAAFAGITADGKAVDTENSAVLVAAPLAKGGRCPTVVFEIDAGLAEGCKGGAYGVYLLDTRLANGRVGGLNVQGDPVAVNGWGAVAAEACRVSENIASSIQTRQATASTFVTTKSADPADAPKPQITAMRIVGDKVYLTVKNTIPCLQYAAKEVEVDAAACRVSKEVESCDQTRQVAASTGIQGAATPDAEITVIVPKKGERAFFSVGRK